MLKLIYLENINQLAIKTHTAEENYRSMFLQNKRRQKVMYALNLFIEHSGEH